MKTVAVMLSPAWQMMLIPPGCGAPVTRHNRPEGAQPRDEVNAVMSDGNESAFACNTEALDDGQRQRYAVLFRRLGEARQEVRELPDGYEFRYPADAATIQAVAEFVTYERLCCPFFNFTLVVESEGGPLRLRLTGREGVKDFIRVEMRMAE